MLETTLTITNQAGLHGRPAKEFVYKTREFKSKITIQNLSRPEAKELPVSALNLLNSAIRQGHQVRIRADGEDAAAALAALTKLIEENFGE